MFGVWWSVLKLFPRPNGTRKAAIIILKQPHALHTIKIPHSIRIPKRSRVHIHSVCIKHKYRGIVLLYRFSSVLIIVVEDVYTHTHHMLLLLLHIYLLHSFIEQTFCIYTIYTHHIAQKEPFRMSTFTEAKIV